MIQTGIFKEFDYGTSQDNIKAYGKAKPPTIDISTI
jgi:hypothetical protein